MIVIEPKITAEQQLKLIKMVVSAYEKYLKVKKPLDEDSQWLSISSGKIE